MNIEEQPPFVPSKDNLVLVNGVPFPSDRAEEERLALEGERKFIQEYGNPEGIKELESRVQTAQQSLKDWQTNNPDAHAYLSAIGAWKLGFDPVFQEDIQNAKVAEQQMREYEQRFGIQYSDLNFAHYSLEELASKGYSKEQINILKAINEGNKLTNAVDASQSTLNRIKSLMK